MEFTHSAWAETFRNCTQIYIKNTTSLITLVPFAPLRNLLMQIAFRKLISKIQSRIHVLTCTMTTSSRHKKQYSRTSTDRYSLSSHCDRRPSAVATTARKRSSQSITPSHARHWRIARGGTQRPTRNRLLFVKIRAYLQNTIETCTSVRIGLSQLGYSTFQRS